MSGEPFDDLWSVAETLIVGPGAERVARLVARMAGQEEATLIPAAATPSSPVAAVCLEAGTAHQPQHRARVYLGVRMACIYPAWDGEVEEMVAQAEVEEGARAIGLTLGVPSVSQVGVVEGLLVDRAFVNARYREAVELASLDDVRSWVGAEPTARDVFHAMAAAALARACGAEATAIHAALRSSLEGPTG